MPARDDERLIRDCLDGDESAWNELIERYAPLIWSIPRRYGLKSAAAEDVFADVCLILVRSLKNIRDPKALPKWIIQATTRATWEAGRRETRHKSEDLPELTGAAPPGEFVEALEAEHHVRRALAGISERCRRLLELLYFDTETPSYDDIAAKMAMPRGSLGPTRRRCLDKMREKLPAALAGDVSGRGQAPPEK
ncbi:MAG: sigma-70 family RNA polymerase sigma factor [Planctomycetota bacterium]|nr:sigma-70 family RNA polymerase sigma factor [Planctomycetota bacterium]